MGMFCLVVEIHQEGFVNMATLFSLNQKQVNKQGSESQFKPKI